MLDLREKRRWKRPQGSVIAEPQRERVRRWKVPQGSEGAGPERKEEVEEATRVSKS